MMKLKLLLAIFLAAFLTACTSSAQASKSQHTVAATSAPKAQPTTTNKTPVYTHNGKQYAVVEKAAVQRGKASYYHKKFNGRHTASGEIYSGAKLTAAHRTLPFGTHVLVTNLRNNRQVIVKINDRGPFSKTKIIDLSTSAASKLGIITAGIADVKVEKLHLVHN